MKTIRSLLILVFALAGGGVAMAQSTSGANGSAVQTNCTQSQGMTKQGQPQINKVCKIELAPAALEQTMKSSMHSEKTNR